MLAIKLGSPPEDLRVMRAWLQERLPEKVGADSWIGKKASQAARVIMVEAVADKKLSTAYDEWIIGQGNP